MSMIQYTAKDSFPPSTAGVGTIDTNGVRFVTSDDEGLSRGDWIYSETENVLRKVKSIVDHVDTKEGTLNEAFPTNLTGESVKIVKSHELEYYATGVVFEGGAGAIDGTPVVEGMSYNDFTSSPDYGIGGVIPIVVDPNGNTAKIYTGKYK